MKRDPLVDDLSSVGGSSGPAAAEEAAVAEIAGVPGLLAQVGPEDAARLTEAPDLQDTIPDTVLPEVMAAVHRERGRLGRTLLALAAGGYALVRRHRQGPSGPAHPA